jgi:hypothetical protein
MLVLAKLANICDGRRQASPRVMILLAAGTTAKSDATRAAPHKNGDAGFVGFATLEMTMTADININSDATRSTSRSYQYK